MGQRGADRARLDPGRAVQQLQMTGIAARHEVCRAGSPQKYSFNPNCITRADAVAATTPARGLPMAALGGEKFARLKALNISHRNWMRRRSPSGNSRWMPRSTLKLPGPTRIPRPELPKVNCGAAANAARSNQRSMLRS